MVDPDAEAGSHRRHAVEVGLVENGGRVEGEVVAMGDADETGGRLLGKLIVNVYCRTADIEKGAELP